MLRLLSDPTAWTALGQGGFSPRRQETSSRETMLNARERDAERADDPTTSAPTATLTAIASGETYRPVVDERLGVWFSTCW